jgi:hypothetical protein
MMAADGGCQSPPSDEMPMSRIAKIRGVLVAVALTFCLAAPAEAEGRLHNLCGWSVHSPREAFDRLTKQPKLRKLTAHQGYIAFHDPVANRVWVFTVTGHPAHPSAICSYETVDDGLFTLRMNVVCGGSKPVCDELVRQFQEHYQKVTERD